MDSTRLPATQPSPSADPPAHRQLPAWWRSPAILPAIGLVATCGIIAYDSLTALALVLFEGNVVAALLTAAGLAGGWFVPVIGLGRAPWRDRVMVGAGLGIGGASLLVLALGSAGLLNRPVALIMVVVFAVAALLRVAVDLRHGLDRARLPMEPGTPAGGGLQQAAANPQRASRHEAMALTPLHYLWLLGCPFLAIAAMAAVLPPGVLWAEEAGGYDVLEYHLAVPKEYFEAQRIFFMPYNAYSNMPSNSEMLSLLMMHLRGDAIEAATMAQLTNVALAGLFVLAAWWTGRLYSREAGIAAGVLAATTPWLTYLAGIAFVEVGMLAMGMLSLGAMLRALCVDEKDGKGAQPPPRLGWAIASGLLAGLSCGYKYTAVPMIALPVGLLALFAPTSLRQRVSGLVFFTLGAAVTFSPWLIRNVINTGNPVFPLAYSVFGAKPGVWDAQLNARWQYAHGSAGAGLESGEPLLRAVISRTVGDGRFGFALGLLAILGVLRRRPLALVLVLILQIAVWFSATHLFARFAVVLLLPMLVLAARAFDNLRSRWAMAVFAGVLTGGAGFNLYQMAGLYYDHTRMGPESQPLAAYGHMNWFVKGEWPGYEYLNIVNALDANARVMFVGEARTYYVEAHREYATVFNHHPLSQAVGELMPRFSTTVTAPNDAAAGSAARDSGAQAVLKWLRRRGITHVLVSWSELGRLRDTYGIDDRLDAETFTRLESAGLARMGDFMFEEDLPHYATLYEVPHE